MQMNFLPLMLLSTCVGALAGSPVAGQSVPDLSAINGPLIARYEDALENAVESASQSWASEKSSSTELDAVCDAADLSWNSSRQEIVSEFATESDHSTLDYCRKMARALALSGVETSPEKKIAANQAAIEAAMRLVVETAALQNRAKIAELNAAHQLERAEFQQQIWRLSAQLSQSSRQANSDQNVDAKNWSTLYQQWLQPLYNSYSRSEHQLQVMARGQTELHRKMAILETKLKPVDALPPQVIQNPMFHQPLSPTPTVASTVSGEDRNKPLPMALRPSSVVRELEEELRQQISELQIQLTNMQQQKVRPAGHLEPMYPQQQPLQPLYQR